MGDSGRQIGEKLFALLSPGQKKDLVQFVRDYEAGNIPADVPYTTLFQDQYFIPQQADQPLTEIREGDLYFCLEQRLVTVRGQVISLTVKEFEIFALLILNPKRVFTYEMLLDYFFDMSDPEIAKLLNLSRSTVQYRRTSSFELLKRYLEERAYGNQE